MLSTKFLNAVTEKLKMGNYSREHREEIFLYLEVWNWIEMEVVILEKVNIGKNG